jgi:hypothetical protein
MNIGIIWDLGRKGIRIMLISLLGTLTIGWALGKLLKDKKMGRILLASCVLFLGLVELLPTLAVRAQEVQVEIVQPPMRFLTADTGLEDKKIEPSGVASIGDGSLLLVACDKNACLSVVEAATGRIKQSFSVGVFDNRPKWEDLAHDDEGAYYVIGSRFVEEPAEEGTQKRLMAVPRLLRFRLRSDGAGGPLVIDSESIVEWDIGDALAAEGYHRDPRKNEVNIEGLTVRTLRDKAGQVTLRELVVGLREPHNPIRVYAADITQLPAPNAKLTLSPLFRFYAGERQGILSGLSSIDYMPEWNGFFILTSTEDRSNRYHGNTLWFLSDERISASRPAQLPPDKIKLGDLRLVEPQKVWLFGLDSKAEGVCVLSEEAASSGSQVRRARLALVYDNDTAKTGNSGALQFVTLLRWPE